jgi:hypothetical protein
MTAYEKMWVTRRERYGVSGLADAPPENPTREELLAKRSTCERGHDLAVHGKLAKPRRTWYLACRLCFNMARRSWRHQQHEPGLVASGVNIPQRKARATRLEKYGPTNCSPEGHAVHQTVGRRNFAIVHARKRAQTRCIHGHEFNEHNTYISKKGHRQCRACRNNSQRERKKFLRGERPEWVIVGKGRVSLAAHDAFVTSAHEQLRAQMIAAHPDKGGSTRAFIVAQKKLNAFVASEVEWYAGVNVAPPFRVPRAQLQERAA